MLYVVKRVENSKSQKARWLCRCDCGRETIVISDKLKSGHTKSCGCYNKKQLLKSITTHGLSKTEDYLRIRRIYNGMKQRCFNKNDMHYKYYGAIGITVCEEWLKGIMVFYEWAMSNGYKKDLSIDRINNDGNYEPNNCRWATAKEQANNKGHKNT